METVTRHGRPTRETVVRRHRSHGVSVLAATLATACALVQDPPAGRRKTCADFERVAPDDPRPALTVLVAGTPRRMRLDTGARRSRLFSDARWETEDETSVLRDITICDRTFPQRMRRGRPVTDDPVGGILGMDFLLGKLVAIDFKVERICFYDDGAKPRRLWPNLRLHDAAIADGRLVLAWSPPDGDPLELFFDTGTGAVPLVLADDAWRRLTGIAPSAAPSRVPTAPRGTGRLVGAPLKRALSFWNVYAETSVSAFTPENGLTPESWPRRVDGLTGGALFRGMTIVIDTRKETPRFGAVPPS